MGEADIGIGRGVGVLQIGASGVYGTVALSSYGPALWVQGAPEPGVRTLDLSNSRLTVRGGPAQMVLRAASDVQVRATVFEGPTCCGLETPDANDATGIQVIASNGHLDLGGVQIAGFGRAGLLIDGEDADQPTFAFEVVTLQPGDADALGVHVQGLAEVSVDGITRTPDLERSDAAAQAEGRELEVAPAHEAPALSLLPSDQRSAH